MKIDLCPYKRSSRLVSKKNITANLLEYDLLYPEKILFDIRIIYYVEELWYISFFII